jgi:non-ribosomal peptide synthetase component F
MLNRVRWALAAYPFNHGNERKEVACHKTSLSFVDSFFEILGPLGSGVPLVVAPMAARVDPGLLLNLLGKFNVTRLILVPSLLRVLIALADENTADNHGAAAKSGSSLVSMIPLLTHWTISGEALSLDLVEAFFRAHPGAKSLLNLYGSTEVAADVTGIEFQPDRNAGYLMKPTLGVGAENMTLVEAEERPVAPTTIAPIGLPLGGCGVLILDPSSLQEVPPIGVQCFDSNEAQGLSAEAERVGEIIVFGRHLATGYLGRPDLTNAAFVWLRKIPTSQPFVGSESAARCYEQLDPSVAADAEAIAAAKANESNFEDERADPTSPLVVPSDGQLFRCFRTGDFGFLDPAGVLFYVGRRDQMVSKTSF